MDKTWQYSAWKILREDLIDFLQYPNRAYGTDEGNFLPGPVMTGQEAMVSKQKRGGSD